MIALFLRPASLLSVRREESQHRSEPFRYVRADVPGGRGYAVTSRTVLAT